MNKPFGRPMWPLLKNRSSHAFTIVELLVVIVVIAILAAITIAAYTGISQKAVVSLLQSDLSNASTAIKAFQVENSNFPTTISTDCSTTPDTSTNKCLKISGSNSYTGYSVNNSANPKTFSLIANNGNYYYRVTSSTAPSQLTPTTQPGVTPGATVELHGAKANGGSSQGINSPLTTTWTDTSSFGNNATLNGFTGTTSDGWTGTGSLADPYRLVFANTNEYVSIPQISMAATLHLTYEAWVSIPSIPVANGTIMREWGSTGSEAVSLTVNSSTGYARFVVRTQTPNQINVGSVAPNICDGAWHHIVGTIDGVYARYYVDGSLISGPVALPAGALSPPNAVIGYSNGTGAIPGSIAVARIYPFALNASQITANYSAGPDW